MVKSVYDFYIVFSVKFADVGQLQFPSTPNEILQIIHLLIHTSSYSMQNSKLKLNSTFWLCKATQMTFEQGSIVRNCAT